MTPSPTDPTYVGSQAMPSKDADASVRSGTGGVGRKHEWWRWKGFMCCKNCGVVMNLKNIHKTNCKGVVKVTLR